MKPIPKHVNKVIFYDDELVAPATCTRGDDGLFYDSSGIPWRQEEWEHWKPVGRVTEPAYGWCIRVPYGGNGGAWLNEGTFARTRTQAISKFMEHWSRPKSWGAFYKRGFRCVKVKLAMREDREEGNHD